MAGFIVKNRIDDPARLKEFNWADYVYDETRSTESELVFVTE